jgi:Tol biopolymer transport system component
MKHFFSITVLVGILLILSGGCSKKSTEPKDDEDQKPNLKGKIVFVSDRSGADELYSMNSQGTEVEQLTENGSEQPDKSYPRLSSDGTKIAFTASGDLCIFDYSGGQIETILSLEENSMYCEDGLSWSPDSKRICFCAGVYSAYWVGDIYIVDLGNKVMTKLTGTRETREAYPAWSPNGDLIAFCGKGLCTMNTSGTEIHSLDTTYSYMDWSPDGSKIVFRGLSLINSDGTGKVSLADGFHPAFSPDGKQIVFCRTKYVHQENIYRMDVDGSDVVRLSTSDQYRDFDPDW